MTTVNRWSGYLACRAARSRATHAGGIGASGNDVAGVAGVTGAGVAAAPAAFDVEMGVAVRAFAAASLAALRRAAEPPSKSSESSESESEPEDEDDASRELERARRGGELSDTGGRSNAGWCDGLPEGDWLLSVPSRWRRWYSSSSLYSTWRLRPVFWRWLPNS